MPVKFYTDPSAARVHAKLRADLEPFCLKNFPNYELSHAGFNENEVTGEIQLRLHLNPIGKVKCAADPKSLEVLK